MLKFYLFCFFFSCLLACPELYWLLTYVGLFLKTPVFPKFSIILTGAQNNKERG
jgi:hypothetical protein